MSPHYPRIYLHLSLLSFLTVLGTLFLAACGTSTTTTSPAATPTTLPLPGGLQEKFTTPPVAGHYGAIYALATDRTGKIIASGGSDHTTRLWDSSSASLIKTIPYPGKTVTLLALNPVGNLLASVGQQEQWIQLWDTATGQQISILKGHTEDVRGLTFSPDGKYLASFAGDKVGKIWDVNNGQIIAELEGATTIGVFSADGSLLVTAYQERQPNSPMQLAVWDTKTWQRRNVLALNAGLYPSELALSPDNRYLAMSNTGGFPIQETQIKVWELETGKESFYYRKSYLEIRGLAFSPDSTRLVGVGNTSTWIKINGIGETDSLPTDSFDFHGYARVWNIASGKEVTALDRNERFLSPTISPDGKYLAVSQGSVIVFYDTTTGKELRRTAGAPAYQTIALSPDGKYIARSEGENIARVIELNGGKDVATLKSTERVFKSLSFSPDGKFLASGGWDGLARLWEVSSGKELRSFARHASWVNAVVFSPDGKTLATAGSDKLVKLWEVASGKETGQLTGYTRAVWSLAFSPDGKFLATGGYAEYKKNNGLVVWELAGAKKAGAQPTVPGNILSLTYSPDGKMLAAMSDDACMSLWDATSGQPVATLVTPPSGNNSILLGGGYVSFSADGRTLLGATQDYGSYHSENYVKLWEVASRREIIGLKLGSDAEGLSAAALSQDGKNIILLYQDGRLQVQEGIPIMAPSTATVMPSPAATTPAISTATPAPSLSLPALKAPVLKELYTLPSPSGHTGTISAARFSSDGKYLFTGSGDGTVRRWEVATHLQVGIYGFSGQSVASFDLSPDEKMLVTAGYQSPIRLWDLESDKLVRELSGHQSPVRQVVFSPDGKNIISGSGDVSDKKDNTVRVWEVASGRELLKLTGHNSIVTGVAATPDGKTIASIDFEGTVKVWERTTGKLMDSLPDYSNGVGLVSFSPDGRYLAAAGGVSGEVRLWEATSLKPVGSIKTGQDYPQAMAFSPDSKIVAVGNSDGTSSRQVAVTVKLFEVATGKLLQTLPSHNLVVQAIAFSPDSKYLATGGGGGVATPDDSSVKLWELSTTRDLGFFKGSAGATGGFFMARDGQSFYAYSGDTSINRYDLATGKLLESRDWPFLREAAVAVSPDQKQIVIIGRQEKIIHVYDFATQKELYKLYGLTGEVWGMSFSPDGRYLVIGDRGNPSQVMVWDAVSWKELRSFPMGDNGYNNSSLNFSPDGKYLFSAGITYYKGSENSNGTLKGTVNVWDFASGKLVYNWPVFSEYAGLSAISPDGKYLAGGSQDKTIKIWELATGKELRTIGGLPAGVGELEFSPDGRMLIATSDNQLFFYEAATGRELSRQTFPAYIYSLSYVPDGNRLLMRLLDGSTRLLELS